MRERERETESMHAFWEGACSSTLLTFLAAYAPSAGALRGLKQSTYVRIAIAIRTGAPSPWRLPTYAKAYAPRPRWLNLSHSISRFLKSMSAASNTGLFLHVHLHLGGCRAILESVVSGRCTRAHR